MLKKLFLSTSAIALAGGLAFAQAPASTDTMGGASIDTMGGRSVGEPATSLSTSQWMVSNIYKANVYGENDQKIGDVDDLVIGPNGDVQQAIIGVGGFLGVGEKDVAIPFQDLKVTKKNGKDWVVLNMTKDELKKAPAYAKPAGK
ncbi:MAG: PRC-barrel domain-containing protein [Methylocapsa sp.]|nr:PRC-barrel domain-containing protein [Methylocapsa sp.]